MKILLDPVLQDSNRNDDADADDGEDDQPVHKEKTWSRGRSPSPSGAGLQCKGSSGPALPVEPSVPDVEKILFICI